MREPCVNPMGRRAELGITRELLRGAMEALESGSSPLLDHLGWAGPVPAELAADRRALLGVASACRRVFPLPVPNAPGLHVFGAEFDPEALAGEAGLGVLGASGIGLDPGRAFAACLGEAAELMAQVETPADRAAGRGPLRAHRWPDGAAREIPREAALRSAGAPRPKSPLSIGCATARAPLEARLSAALELIERDAVALWWRGGRPPRPVDDAALSRIAGAAPLLARLVGGVRLLDITTEWGVPVVAAISFRADGTGFCCGTGARPEMADAAQAALLELCQNELAILLVEAKRAGRGEAALNPRDLVHLARHAAVRDGVFAALQPNGPPGTPLLRGDDAATRLDELARRLDEAGRELIFLDHTRKAVGLPVFRAVIPGLACEPSTDLSPRLEATIRSHSGGPGLDPGILLFA